MTYDDHNGDDPFPICPQDKSYDWQNRENRSRPYSWSKSA